MARSDIYEALAFLKAAKATRAILLYPAPEALEARGGSGICIVFERIVVDSFEIIGLFVDPRGISKAAGFGTFYRSLASSIRAWE
jgi:hypothetical protein